MKRTSTPGRSKRWLVVDDNAALGEVIYLCLGQLGLATVEWYTSAAEALEATSFAPDDIELLVTDCDMPGVGGLELARDLRCSIPMLKVLLVTANHADLTAAKLVSTGAFAVLPKPFSLKRLEWLVRGAVCESDIPPWKLHGWHPAFAA